jgi:hypothetical protein
MSRLGRRCRKEGPLAGSVPKGCGIRIRADDTVSGCFWGELVAKQLLTCFTKNQEETAACIGCCSCYPEGKGLWGWG